MGHVLKMVKQLFYGYPGGIGNNNRACDNFFSWQYMRLSTFAVHYSVSNRVKR